MGKFEVEDFTIGDFVYFKSGIIYHIAKLTRITKTQKDVSLWGYWSDGVSTLPKTIEEFETIKTRKEHELYVSISDIAGILNFSNNAILKNNSISEYLSDIDGYETNTIIALNEMLKDEFDIEDLLRVLIPSVVHRLKETKALEISE